MSKTKKSMTKSAAKSAAKGAAKRAAKRAVAVLACVSACSVGTLSGCSTSDVLKDRFTEKTSRERMEQSENLLKEADHHYRTGNLDEAEALYLELLNKSEKNPEALYRLGNIAFKRADYRAASQYFAEAIESLPRNAKAHYNLAVTYLTLSEQHFKYYTATVPESTDIEKVSNILKDIYEFASGKGGSRQQQTTGGGGGDSVMDALESLADQF